MHLDNAVQEVVVANIVTKSTLKIYFTLREPLRDEASVSKLYVLFPSPEISAIVKAMGVKALTIVYICMHAIDKSGQKRM